PRAPLCAQGPLMFLSCVVLSKEVRRSLRLSCARRHHPPLATKATLTPVSAGGGAGGAGGARGSPPATAVTSLSPEDSGLAGSPGPLPLPEPGGLFLDPQDQ
ncbi:CELR2 protein, partial [Sapayoa aenigma]|nr:CELR2 protein [Sapayoa aenigma]